MIAPNNPIVPLLTAIVGTCFGGLAVCIKRLSDAEAVEKQRQDATYREGLFEQLREICDSKFDNALITAVQKQTRHYDDTMQELFDNDLNRGDSLNNHGNKIRELEKAKNDAEDNLFDIERAERIVNRISLMQVRLIRYESECVAVYRPQPGEPYTIGVEFRDEFERDIFEKSHGLNVCIHGHGDIMIISAPGRVFRCGKIPFDSLAHIDSWLGCQSEQMVDICANGSSGQIEITPYNPR